MEEQNHEIDFLFKEAERHPDLDALLLAKELSDKKQYLRKNYILRNLLNKSPESFIISEPEKSGIVGITHFPTNFRIHTLARDLPESLRAMSNEISNQLAIKKAAMTRVMYLLETKP